MERQKRKRRQGFTRRDFFKNTSGAAAGAALAGLSLSPRPAGAAELPQRWDEEAEVVIVGSGFAGLAAAHEARKAGASVIILEKMPTPGGNSIINGGVVAAAGSPLQTKQGIEDSAELLYQDMLKAGLSLNHPDLARLVANQSNETVQWTITELGVKYHDQVVHLGGHSVPRSYSTHNRSGSAIVNRQLAKLQELGVTVRTRTILKKLIRTEDCRVVGVEVEEGYRFPKPGSGRAKVIRANRAVVLASGGFGNDLAFRTVQNPLLGREVESTNQPGATAEALLEAFCCGATPVQISWIQLGPWTSPDEKGFGMAPHFVAEIACVHGLWVDPATGRRFVNELADRKIRADAILRTGHPCLALCDAGAVERLNRQGVVAKLMERGVVRKFDSLAGLAAAYQVPAAPLKETVDRFNSFVQMGKDEEFGKYLAKEAAPLTRPPYYAARIWPKIHHTMGGLRINTKAQVVDLSGNPIKGLYAAGEVAGGVHGAVRLGSCATLDCLVFGRIAGGQAAAEEDWV